MRVGRFYAVPTARVIFTAKSERVMKLKGPNMQHSGHMGQISSN